MHIHFKKAIAMLIYMFLCLYRCIFICIFICIYVCFRMIMPYISLHVDIEICTMQLWDEHVLLSRYLLICAHRIDRFNWTHVIMHSMSIPHIQYSFAYVYVYIYIYAICIPYDHMYKMYASIYPHPSSKYIKNVEEQTLNLCYVYIYICAYPIRVHRQNM